jgi:hypothetical protein
MTNTPNNIAGEEWENQFDDRFGDNLDYWREIVAEIEMTGDPDFKSLKAFISKTRQDAIAEHDARWHPITDKMQMENLHYVQEAIAGERFRAAEIVKGWHIKKGGYEELAHTILNPDA